MTAEKNETREFHYVFVYQDESGKKYLSVSDENQSGVLLLTKIPTKRLKEIIADAYDIQAKACLKSGLPYTPKCPKEAEGKTTDSMVQEYLDENFDELVVTPALKTIIEIVVKDLEYDGDYPCKDFLNL